MATSCDVSVVIPTHNRADLVPLAVRSVLAQEPPPRELIVVDEASTDRTVAALEEFGAAIRVLRTESNAERGAARNIGADAAAGRILAFLDSDDEWKPDKLARQLPLALAGRPSVTGVEFVDADGRSTGRIHRPPQSARRDLLRHNHYLGSPSSLLVPTSTFRAIGGFPEEREVQGSEDWLMLIKLALAGHCVEVVPEPLIRYRVHTTNSTAEPEVVERAMWSAVSWLEREDVLDTRRARGTRAHVAGLIARAFASRGRWIEARRWTGRTLRYGGPWRGGLEAALVALSAGRGVLRRRGI